MHFVHHRGTSLIRLVHIESAVNEEVDEKEDEEVEEEEDDEVDDEVVDIQLE